MVEDIINDWSNDNPNYRPSKDSMFYKKEPDSRSIFFSRIKKPDMDSMFYKGIHETRMLDELLKSLKK